MAEETSNFMAGLWRLLGGVKRRKFRRFRFRNAFGRPRTSELLELWGISGFQKLPNFQVVNISGVSELRKFLTLELPQLQKDLFWSFRNFASFNFGSFNFGTVPSSKRFRSFRNF